MKQKKIRLVSLGCKKNQIDSEVVLGSLLTKGYQLAQNEDEADIVFVNTCSFVKDAQDESRNAINEIISLKEQGKIQKVIVGGCMPQRYKEDLVREFPLVDVFIGLDEINKLPRILDKKESYAISSVSQFVYNDETPRLNTESPHLAYVKISEGCNRVCSFCMIPAIRGRFRSRPIDSIYRECANLVHQGVAEINIVSQDTTYYGKDMNDGASLYKLLEKLATLKKLRWLRLFYNYPIGFNDNVIKLMANEEKLVKYVDLPVQHASDRMLKLMRRGVHKKHMLELFAAIKKEIKDVFLRTTLIVGFPGETDRDFQELCDFIEKIEFNHVGVFKYSDEKDSHSYTLPDKVPAHVIDERFDHIMKKAQKIAHTNNKNLVGKKFDAVIETENDEKIIGRISGQAREVDGITYIQGTSFEPGKFVQVEIKKGLEYDLVAHAC